MHRTLLVILGVSLALCGVAAAAGKPAREFQPIGKIKLEPADDGDARGRIALAANRRTDELKFKLTARGLEPTSKGEALGVWLVGGGRSRFLGFAPAVTKDGRVGASGPLESDARRFPRWLRKAHRFVLTRETRPRPRRPGEAVLRGDVRQAAAGRRWKR